MFAIKRDQRGENSDNPGLIDTVADGKANPAFLAH